MNKKNLVYIIAFISISLLLISCTNYKAGQAYITATPSATATESPTATPTESPPPTPSGTPSPTPSPSPSPLCDSDVPPDGVLDSGYLCDYYNSGVKDECYLCETDGDGVEDKCWICDSDEGGINDSCYLCYSPDHTLGDFPDNCYQCNHEYDTNNRVDDCFRCDHNPDILNREDDCYRCNHEDDPHDMPDDCFTCDFDCEEGPKDACNDCDNDRDGINDSCCGPHPPKGYANTDGDWWRDGQILIDCSCAGWTDDMWIIPENNELPAFSNLVTNEWYPADAFQLFSSYWQQKVSNRKYLIVYCEDGEVKFRGPYRNVPVDGNDFHPPNEPSTEMLLNEGGPPVCPSYGGLHPDARKAKCEPTPSVPLTPMPTFTYPY